MHLGSAVDRLDPERPSAPGRVGEQRDRDVGPAGPDVEHRERRAIRPQPGDRQPAQPRPAEQPIDPSEVPEVAGHRVEIVERPVEDLLDAGQPFHRQRLHRGRFAATPGWYPRRDGPSERAPARPRPHDRRGRRARRAARGARHPRVRGPRPVLPDAERRRPWHRRRRDPAALPGGAGRIRPGQLARRRHRRPQPDRRSRQRRLRPGDDARDQGVPVVPWPRPDRRRRRHRPGTRSSSRSAPAPTATP